MWEIVIKKIQRKKKQLLRKWNEPVRLENEIVIFEIVFEMVHGWSYEGFQKKIPHIPISIARHWNFGLACYVCPKFFWNSL